MQSFLTNIKYLPPNTTMSLRASNNAVSSTIKPISLTPATMNIFPFCHFRKQITY